MTSPLAFAAFERAFARPFRYGDRQISARTGVLVRKDGFVSEAAPLPGHSRDSAEEVWHALSTRPTRELLSLPPDLPPSLRFALEGLEALAKPGPRAVRSNAVVRWEGAAETRPLLEAARRADYDVCKIKIGPGDWAPLLELIETTADLRFRLDANLSLDERQLVALARELETRALLSRVEYLEEPFPGAWQRENLRGLPLALAADESAPDLAAAERLLEAPNPPAVFVVKPTVAGALFSLEAPLARLRKAGRKIVFTSALETEPGRRTLLAYLSRGVAETSGLSTGHLFRENFLADQAEWAGVPPPEDAESRWLAGLSWTDCR